MNDKHIIRGQPESQYFKKMITVDKQDYNKSRKHLQ
jgi:hypothetical protein